MTGMLVVEIHVFAESDEARVLAAIQNMGAVLSASRIDQEA